MIRERVKALEGESDFFFYSSVSSASIIMMRDRVMTDCIRKRLSVQNEVNWSKERTLGDPTSQK